jgi:hypothetical protein
MCLERTQSSSSISDNIHGLIHMGGLCMLCTIFMLYLMLALAPHFLEVFHILEEALLQPVLLAQPQLLQPQLLKPSLLQPLLLNLLQLILQTELLFLESRSLQLFQYLQHLPW